jgi:hypothetical protein
MKYIKLFLEWLFSFFYTKEELRPDVEFTISKQSSEEWNKLSEPRKLYYRHGSSYLFRLRRFQMTNGLYPINYFKGV